MLMQSLTILDTLRALIPGIAAFIIFFTSHLLLWHTSLIKEKGVVLLTKLSFLSYAVAFFIVMFFDGTTATIPEHYWFSLPFYILLVMLYFHFYVGFDRSVSIRILGEIAESPKQAMTLKEVQKKYSLVHMLKPRLDTMVSHHWLSEVKERYECTRKGAFLAKLTLIIQKLYRLDNTG